ncbi:TPA: hypothetical protein ACIZC1_002575 [Enterococcus faecalis]
MTQPTNEMKWVIAQILLIDPTSEHPRIHPKRTEMKKGQLTKRLELLVQAYEEKNVPIDLEPYKETIKTLRKMRMQGEYQTLIDEIVLGVSVANQKEKQAKEARKKMDQSTIPSSKKREKKEEQSPISINETEKTAPPKGWLTSLKSKVSLLKKSE